MVTVRRWGRGLQVVPDPPYHPEPMSIIGDDEVEWMLMPNSVIDVTSPSGNGVRRVM